MYTRTHEAFKCVMPIFQNEILSSLSSNTTHIIHKFDSTVLSSVYNTFNGIFHNGFLLVNENCNWQNIKKNLETAVNDLSTLYQECTGIIIPIHDIISDKETGRTTPILKKEINPTNDTITIFDQTYATNDNIFSLNNKTYLGLSECTPKFAISILKDYLQSLIPTTITTTTTTTTESSIDILKNALDFYGISLENVSPTQIGKSVLNALNIPFLDPTTTTTTEAPNDGANDGSYTGTYIAIAATTSLALGIALGYGIKYGIDWYKGKNSINHTEEEHPLLIETGDIYQARQFIQELIQKLQELAKIDEKYEEIEESTNTSLQSDYNILINLLKGFNKTLQNDRDIIQILTELDNLVNQEHKLDSNICQQNLYKLQTTLQSSNFKYLKHFSDSDSAVSENHANPTPNETSLLIEEQNTDLIGHSSHS